MRSKKVIKRYSREFQDQACKLVTDEGYTQQQAGQAVGVTRETIGDWLGKRGLTQPRELVEPDYAASDDPRVLRARIAELEKRLRRSELEKEILKKATAFFASQSL